MKLSVFGEKFARDSGIVELMDDLGTSLVENPGMIMMGGGNPGRLPAAEAVFQQRLEDVMNDWNLALAATPRSARVAISDLRKAEPR